MQENARLKRIADRRRLEQQQHPDPVDADDQDDQDHDDQNGQSAQNDQNAQNVPIDSIEDQLFVSLTGQAVPNEPDNLPNDPNQQAENGQSGPSAQQPQKNKPTQPKRKKKNYISAEEKRKSLSYGLDIARAKAKGKSMKPKQPGRKRKAKKSESTDADAEGAGPPTKKKKTQRKGIAQQHGVDNLDDLFSANVVANANANSSQSEIPAMVGKDKGKALTRLVAGIPSANQSEAKSDKQKVLHSSKQFTNPARSDGQGGWKIKGLQTSLFHYQV
jgi:hypothetical protein